MPIPVPPSSPPPSPPRIDGDHIPQNEHPSVSHLLGLLQLLGWYEWQFRHALTLFDLCQQETSDLSAKRDIKEVPKYPIIEASWHTLSAWKTMAARDGAMAIYHFGQALTAIPPRLHECPTVAPLVSHAAIRLARKSFTAVLPSYDAIRHAVGHAADFNATIEERDIHSIKPPWKGRFGLEIVGTKPVRLTEQLFGRTYCVTYRGRVHSYEINAETLDVLSKARERTYAAFNRATDPEFYQCPYCARRDLMDVYGGRVYQCATCDRLVTDEEFLRARFIRARKTREGGHRMPTE